MLGLIMASCRPLYPGSRVAQCHLRTFPCLKVSIFAFAEGKSMNFTELQEFLWELCLMGVLDQFFDAYYV